MAKQPRVLGGENYKYQLRTHSQYIQVYFLPFVIGGSRSFLKNLEPFWQLW